MESKENNSVYNSNIDLNKVTFQASFQYSIKPAFTIVELRKDSPAEKAGLRLGDIILSVNNKNTSALKMHEVISMFSDKDGKLIRLKVDRNGVTLNYEFKLESLF